MSTKAIVIGSGFAGLSAATKLADAGMEVIILEKNSSPGGRARLFEANGFRFDMGPSWYWMPDVFENYFANFGKKVSDYYDLVRLDPSYRVILKDKSIIDLPASSVALADLFESLEPGAAKQLERFLEESKYKYTVGIGEFVWKPSISVAEFLDLRLVTKAFSLDLFATFSKHIRKFFKDPRILQIMEFPVLFLGATPQNTPALYSLMNYAEMALGTWYPMGGMHEIIKGMVALAEEKGVKIICNKEVNKIETCKGLVSKIYAGRDTYYADVVVGAADYHHIETKLLSQEDRNYNDKYWDKRTMAPSSLLFYLGIEGRLDNLLHHNLFFDEDFAVHAHEIYEDPSWPSKPLFYACVPSKTDPSVAPVNSENLFLLIPIAPDLEDTDSLREKYFNILLERLEKHCGSEIGSKIVYKKSFAVNDFKSEYNSFKGNAYGLANTLKQTAILKPSMINKKIDNLFYTGQLTVPGPGVPPSLISGLVVANEILKRFPVDKKYSPLLKETYA